jgi:hypothetical protein
MSASDILVLCNMYSSEDEDMINEIIHGNLEKFNHTNKFGVKLKHL